MLDWSSAPLSEGLACYRRAQFFEAHEHWELVWLALNEPEKSFLQALVQITAAMHHLRKGNGIGAASLLRRSLKRLSRCASEFGGINVEPLRHELTSVLEAIGRGAQPADIIAPNIQPTDAQPQ
jgi:predicted metal-dependent hydrolase